MLGTLLMSKLLSSRFDATKNRCPSHRFLCALVFYIFPPVLLEEKAWKMFYSWI